MKRYSVHFIDRQNYVFACEEILSFSDADAIIEIQERPVPGFCKSFEIWRLDTLIFRGSIMNRRMPALVPFKSFGSRSQRPSTPALADPS